MANDLAYGLEARQDCRVSDEGTEGTVLAQSGREIALPAPVTAHRRWTDWTFYALLALSSLGLLYVASLPGWPLSVLLPVLGVWFVVGVLWLCLLVSAIDQRSLNASLIVGPVVALVAAALFVSPWPLQARFAAGRSSFDAAVRSLPPGQTEGGSLGMVGSYRISQWNRSGDGVVFFAAGGTGLVDDAGFAFSSSGVPDVLTRSDDPGFEVTGWQDLGGGWYAWQASW